MADRLDARAPRAGGWPADRWRARRGWSHHAVIAALANTDRETGADETRPKLVEMRQKAHLAFFAIVILLIARILTDAAH